MADKSIKASFRARARILSLLGDQLIGSDHLAIFELVKNAYDADATSVKVRLQDLETDDPYIRILDDGDGMDLSTIRDIWLEPASDHREIQRQSGIRSKKFHRLPLGEKGVGRFAVHKLGNRISMTTRPRGSSEEYRVVIDWGEVTRTRYLDQTQVTITARTPSYFTGKKGHPSHGTRIKISELKRSTWTRGDVRKLWRSITAISSPFDANDAFRATLEVPDHPSWLQDMPDVAALLELAPWRFDFSFDGRFSWSYEFKSPLPSRLNGKKLTAASDNLLIEAPKGSRSRPVADQSILEGIGPISGSFIAFDRDRKILALLKQTELVKGFLDEQGGVRVYRDGMRVHNYGEPADDWLGLDIRRVNRPAQRLSRNIVLGAVNLRLANSTALREKTNREGFEDSDAFDRLKTVVTAAVHKFEVERALDKDRLRKLIDDGGPTSTVPVEGTLKELREALQGNPDAGRLVPLVDRVTVEYEEMRDLLLRAGLTGINLGVIVHEVERGIRSLHEAVRRGLSNIELELMSRNLMGLVESVAGLLRQKSKDKVDLRALIQEAAKINERRYARHRVKVTYNLAQASPDPVVVVGSYALLLNVLINLIDNAIYWLRVRWPDGSQHEEEKRQLYIGLENDPNTGPYLVVADNGPGFQDEPDILTKPFFTRRPDGIGLGLYYASLAMSLSGGELSFPEKGDAEVPAWVDGAVLTMHFKKGA